MNIVIISGSVRTGRKSHHVAIELHKRFVQRGMTDTHILDLAEYELPVMDEKYAEGGNMPEGLSTIRRQLLQADAMVFLSPEYHGSYSGALKNALDYFWEEFQRKPIGVVAVASGRMGGINASTEMQQLVLSLGAYPIPYKLLVPMVQNAFDEKGEIKESFLSGNFDKFIAEFCWLADAIVTKKRRDTEK